MKSLNITKLQKLNESSRLPSSRAAFLAENWYPRRRRPSRAISRRFAACYGAGFADRIQQTCHVQIFGKQAHDVRLEGHHRLAVRGLARAFGERKGDAASLEGFGLRQLEEAAVVIVVFAELFPAGR